ncbi:MAG: DsbA family oxidoreductase [Acidimicrobiales bacterium]
MADLAFTVNWDYRCPFARNAHEHLVAGLQDGAAWDVRFVPFSLDQVHVAEGGIDVWDDPGKATALLAMQAGIVVRDTRPERFLDAHLALFRARHDEGRDLRDEDVVAEVLTETGLDGAEILGHVAEGWPLATFRKAHDQAVAERNVFGVPTFVAGDRAVFVRLMDRPGDDGAKARATIERVLDLVTGWAELNELKTTTIPR